MNDHLHFLLKESDVLYFYNYSQCDSSSIVLLYSGIDVVDEVNVNTGFHSPSLNSSVMYNGLFTFLFSSGGMMNENDIFQLTGSPSAGVSELDTRHLVSPNPVSAGQFITLELNENMTDHLHTGSGQLVQTFELQTGKNQISTSGLLSGVYFLGLNKEVIRLVVK